ncbi:MAG: hypothetical protein JNJ43_09080, partial [Anaerolineales bacterium]|nr:hypothetical protein [Anaerolineales bacterium]
MKKEKDKQDELEQEKATEEGMPEASGQDSAERDALINQLKEAEAKII